VVAAFAIGFGASAIWLQSAAFNATESSRGPATVQAGVPAGEAAAGALRLKIDADAAGFAARAASMERKLR
jgi:hypothetical protein